MKRIVLITFSFVAFLKVVQAADLEETGKKIFFHSIPDRKTAEEILSPLLAQESWESPVLPEKLSAFLSDLFTHGEGIQEKCESLAHSLNTRKVNFWQQLAVLSP